MQAWSRTRPLLRRGAGRRYARWFLHRRFASGVPLSEDPVPPSPEFCTRGDHRKAWTLILHPCVSRSKIELAVERAQVVILRPLPPCPLPRPLVVGVGRHLPPCSCPLRGPHRRR